MQELRTELGNKVFTAKKEKRRLSFYHKSPERICPSFFPARAFGFTWIACFTAFSKITKSVQGVDGYLVFLRGQDKWGIRERRAKTAEKRLFLSYQSGLMRTLFYLLL